MQATGHSCAVVIVLDAVVIASRCPSGRVWDGYGYEGAYRDLCGAGVLLANGLNGQKARIKLMVVLEAAEDRSPVTQLWAS